MPRVQCLGEAVGEAVHARVQCLGEAVHDTRAVSRADALCVSGGQRKSGRTSRCLWHRDATSRALSLL